MILEAMLPFSLNCNMVKVNPEKREGVPIKGLLTFKLCPSLTFPLQEESEIEEVGVNENKCPLIVEVSPGFGLRMKFISVCQLSLKSGKYQVPHQNLTKIMTLFAIVCL